MSRRDEILARLEAITELPWLPWIEGKPDPRPGHTGLARGGDHCVVGASGFEISADPWNAEFIAHAPEDIRWLLAMADKVEKLATHYEWLAERASKRAEFNAVVDYNRMAESLRALEGAS